MPPDATAAPHRPVGPGAGGYTLDIGACGTANKEKRGLLIHRGRLRTSMICLIFPGCCRMSRISSVVLRCRGVCAAGMRAASGCCACLCSAGIHRRAVGLLIPSSRNRRLPGGHISLVCCAGGTYIQRIGGSAGSHGAVGRPASVRGH